jgi:ubiquinone/menaquinone biosynthesis C-methylase UbiE
MTSETRARHVYTHGHDDSVLRSHRWRTIENSAAYLLPFLRSGVDLLDVGCGPGNLTRDFAARVTPGRVCGVDTSAEIIAAATRDYPGVEFMVGDVYGLPFADESWDVVHAHQVLQHLADPVAALRQMRRVVRAGGIVAVRDSDYATFTWHPMSEGLERWLRLYHEIARANGGEPDAGRRLYSWAQQVGFTRVDTFASSWCFATKDERSWWGGLWADRVTTSAIARQALAEGRATREDLASMADAWRTWAAADDGWFALLHGEIICTR